MTNRLTMGCCWTQRRMKNHSRKDVKKMCFSFKCIQCCRRRGTQQFYFSFLIALKEKAVLFLEVFTNISKCHVWMTNAKKSRQTFFISTLDICWSSLDVQCDLMSGVVWRSVLFIHHNGRRFRCGCSDIHRRFHHFRSETAEEREIENYNAQVTDRL